MENFENIKPAKFRSMTYDQVRDITDKYGKEIDEVIRRFKEETGLDVHAIESYDNGKPTLSGDIVSWQIIAR